MNKDTAYMLSLLQSLGITWDDALALRKCAMTLQRWQVLACNYHIERDAKGVPHIQGKRIADKEKGARKRLAAIMEKYPALMAYVQTDPRGAPLYIVRKEDIPKLTREEWLKSGPVDKSEEAFKHAQERQIEGYYSRGIAVYK